MRGSGGGIATRRAREKLGRAYPALAGQTAPTWILTVAFEFIAATSARDIPFVALAERLQRAGICVTESATSEGARFRWPDTERRENWPEDAELSATECGLLLTIHSGAREQRSRLVEAVASIASELLEQPIAFEET